MPKWEWSDNQSNWSVTFDTTTGKLTWCGWDNYPPFIGNAQEQTTQEFLTNTGIAFDSSLPDAIRKELKAAISKWKQTASSK